MWKPSTLGLQLVRHGMMSTFGGSVSDGSEGAKTLSLKPNFYKGSYTDYHEGFTFLL